MSINHVTLSGRLGSTPELKYTQSKLAILNFSIAHSSWSPAEGESSMWFDVVVFDKLAERLNNNLKKGDEIVVEGKIKIRSYKGRDGLERKITEVTAYNVNRLAHMYPKAPTTQAQSVSQHTDSSLMNENDIPF